MAVAPPEEVTAARREMNGRTVGIVAVVLVLLLAVLWFLFLRGGGEETPSASPTPVPVPTTAPEPEPSPTGKKPGDGPVETFEVFAPRDPFDPLITLSEEGGAPAAGGDGTDTGDGGDGGGIDGNGGNGGNGPDSNGSVGGHSVRLIEVNTDAGTAQVQVDGTVFTVGEGEVFADNFQLLSVSGECATMLFGDDQFTLCEGEEILK